MGTFELEQAPLTTGVSRILVFGGVSFSDVVLGDLWVLNPG